MSAAGELEGAFGKALDDLEALADRLETATNTRATLLKQFDAIRNRTGSQATAQSRELAAAIGQTDRQIRSLFAAIDHVLDTISPFNAPRANKENTRE